MPHSHHSHSGQFCRHAKDTLEDVVIEAIRQGFQVFGLSEHAPRYRLEDLFPEESDLTPSDLLNAYLSFLSEAQRVRSQYSTQLSLLIGIETDYITALDSAGLSHLLSTQNEVIDYIVGSVHHVDGVSIDFDRSTWLRAVRDLGLHSTTMKRKADGNGVELYKSTDENDKDDPKLGLGYVPSEAEMGPFISAYLDAQYDLMRNHQPEVIGHFDLCLLFTPTLSLTSPNLVDAEGKTVWEKVERNVKYAISYGALFEANASAIRKGWSGSYPSPDVLHLILSLGGRICLSDDSHGISYVGLNYLPMREYLVNSGVENVWHLVPISQAVDTDHLVGSRGRVVARKVENWTGHSFWDRLAVVQAQEKL